MASLAASSTIQTFDTVTQLTDLGDGTFRGLVSATWTIGGRPNGGYLLSMLARAATTVTRHHVIAASSHYLRSPQPGPVTVTADVLQAGKSASQVRARMDQADQGCVEVLITVGHLDRDTNAHWDVGAPAIPTVAFDDAQTLVARLPTGAPVAIMEQVPCASIPIPTASHAAGRADEESSGVGSPYPATATCGACVGTRQTDGSGPPSRRTNRSSTVMTGTACRPHPTASHAPHVDTTRDTWCAAASTAQCAADG
jgi:hypothetical protein